MRITELLEGKNFNDLDFVRQDKDKRELDFDLVEDLAFFMNNDDDTYRRHVYPSITKCMNIIKSKKEISPSIFKTAALESYKNYVKKYPIRELPDELDNKLCEKVCKKLADDFHKHHGEGKYKD